MKKIIEAIRRISSFLVISILILFVAYFVFIHYFQNFLPLPVFIETKRIYVNSLAVAFLVLLPVIAISNYSKIIRIALLILVIPFCCLFTYMSIDLPEKVLDSTEFGNHRYYITVEGMIDETYVVYSTYRCNINDFGCERIYTETSGSLDSVALIADQKANELHVLRNGYVNFIDGAQPREILTNEQYGDFIYYVGVYPPYGSSSEQHSYMLFKCKNTFLSCQKLPFNYIGVGGSFKLIFDENIDELKVYLWRYNADDVLIYSYGTGPKCYVEECTIPDN